MTYKIYALKNPSFAKPYIKIGLTKDIEQRIKTLSGSTPEPFELAFSVDTGSSNIKLATAIENFLHITFTAKRCNSDREFFLVQPKYVLFKLLTLITNYHDYDYTTDELIENYKSEASIQESYISIFNDVNGLEREYKADFYREVPIDKVRDCQGDFLLKRLGWNGSYIKLKYRKNWDGSGLTAFTNLS
jgi:hypothetical protein